MERQGPGPEACCRLLEDGGSPPSTPTPQGLPAVAAPSWHRQGALVLLGLLVLASPGVVWGPQARLYGTTPQSSPSGHAVAGGASALDLRAVPPEVQTGGRAIDLELVRPSAPCRSAALLAGRLLFAMPLVRIAVRDKRSRYGSLTPAVLAFLGGVLLAASPLALLLAGGGLPRKLAAPLGNPCLALVGCALLLLALALSLQSRSRKAKNSVEEAIKNNGEKFACDTYWDQTRYQSLLWQRTVSCIGAVLLFIGYELTGALAGAFLLVGHVALAGVFVVTSLILLLSQGFIGVDALGKDYRWDGQHATGDMIEEKTRCLWRCCCERLNSLKFFPLFTLFGFEYFGAVLLMSGGGAAGLRMGDYGTKGVEHTFGAGILVPVMFVNWMLFQYRNTQAGAPLWMMIPFTAIYSVVFGLIFAIMLLLASCVGANLGVPWDDLPVVPVGCSFLLTVLVLATKYVHYQRDYFGYGENVDPRQEFHLISSYQNLSLAGALLCAFARES